MNISKKIHPLGKSLLRLLRSTPEGRLQLAEGQRPPATTYALSLTRTLRRLDAVLDGIRAYTLSAQLDVHNGADQDLATASAELLRQLARHGEDCRLIVDAYFGAGSDVSRRFFAGTRAITEPRELHAARLAACGERVRLLAFMAPAVFIPGFFVEGEDASGHPGPDLPVHGERATAFSYAMFLRRAFVDVLSLNSRVYEAVAGAGIRENKDIAASENIDLIRLAKRLAELPVHVFPDEAQTSLPAIGVKRDAQGEAATVATSSLKKPLPPPARCTISVSTDAGKQVEGYRVPYA